MFSFVMFESSVIVNTSLFTMGPGVATHGVHFPMSYKSVLMHLGVYNKFNLLGLIGKRIQSQGKSGRQVGFAGLFFSD